MNNNVTIAQIKEALKVWELLGVNESSLGEVEIYIINTIMNSAPYLVTTLEDAHRENERLCTEHAAMKEALESALNVIDDAISVGEMEKRNFLFSPWADLVDGSKEITEFLSILQCPTE